MCSWPIGAQSSDCLILSAECSCYMRPADWEYSASCTRLLCTNMLHINASVVVRNHLFTVHKSKVKLVQAHPCNAFPSLQIQSNVSLLCNNCPWQIVKYVFSCQNMLLQHWQCVYRMKLQNMTLSTISDETSVNSRWIDWRPRCISQVLCELCVGCFPVCSGLILLLLFCTCAV